MHLLLYRYDFWIKTYACYVLEASQQNVQEPTWKDNGSIHNWHAGKIEKDEDHLTDLQKH